ncbi:hypothetical protein BN1708_019703, partial [Verticillium longisporum]
AHDGPNPAPARQPTRPARRLCL